MLLPPLLSPLLCHALTTVPSLLPMTLYQAPLLVVELPNAEAQRRLVPALRTNPHLANRHGPAWPAQAYGHLAVAPR